MTTKITVLSWTVIGMDEKQTPYPHPLRTHRRILRRMLTNKYVQENNRTVKGLKKPHYEKKPLGSGQDFYRGGENTHSLQILIKLSYKRQIFLTWQ